MHRLWSEFGWLALPLSVERPLPASAFVKLYVKGYKAY
jgi:hypothetical protein